VSIVKSVAILRFRTAMFAWTVWLVALHAQQECLIVSIVRLAEPLACLVRNFVETANLALLLV